MEQLSLAVTQCQKYYESKHFLSFEVIQCKKWKPIFCEFTSKDILVGLTNICRSLVLIKEPQCSLNLDSEISFDKVIVVFFAES